MKHVELFRTSDLPIRYHVKIRSEANPYDPAYREYFETRDSKRKSALIKDRLSMSQSFVERVVT